jgi:hypothetical protein
MWAKTFCIYIAMLVVGLVAQFITLTGNAVSAEHLYRQLL